MRRAVPGGYDGDVSVLFPENLAHDDEEFWRDQELRRQHLGQPCCTQSNMSWSLIDIPGDLCVVIHGESDCLNCFFHHHGARAPDYFSTRLSEKQLIMGDTRAPLRRLLELIAKERAPEAVLVLGTCPVEVIYDDFEPVVRDVSRETGIPMIPLRTHGLSLVSLISCQDWLYATLASLGGSAAATHDEINLVGLPPGPESREVGRLLGELGVTVGGLYPHGASLASWRRIARARRSFVVDQTMLPRLSALLAGYGQQPENVPLPLGLYHTERFYQLIADRMGVASERVEATLQPEIDRHVPSYVALRERVAGRKLALCIRMLKTHRADLLAYEGLTALELLRGLGFELRILVQGPPEEEARRSFATRLTELGYGDVPFDVFRGPWELGELLRAGGFDVAVMSDVARNVVEGAGVQMIPSQAWRPLFAGMNANFELLSQVADRWA